MRENRKYAEILDKEIFAEFKNKDFSKENKNKYKNLDILLNKLENNILERSENYMKNRKTLSPKYIVAATLITVLTFSTVIYGQDIVKFVQEKFLGNYAHYSVDNSNPIWDIPQDLIGKIFDKKGNIIKNLNFDSPESYEMYNEIGEQIYLYDDGSGVVILDEKAYSDLIQIKADEINNMYFYTYNFLEAEKYFTYDYIIPTYIPDGYKLQKIGLFKDENGVPRQGTEYMTIFYNNSSNNTIRIDLRYLNEDTAFSQSASKLEVMDINSNEAVFIGKTLDIEIDNVMYSINCQNEDMREELILIAKSLTESN